VNCTPLSHSTTQEGSSNGPAGSRWRGGISASEAYYDLVYHAEEGKHLTNRAKSAIRVRSESGHRTSFVGHPDGDDAGDNGGDDTDGAVRSKPFSIAVYRASSHISRGVKALCGSSANQE
jgi:hypothetical protein